METYDLAELSVAQGPLTWNLVFSRAKLMIVSEYGSRLWYIDIDGMTDVALLKRFAESHEIEVEVKSTTIGGRHLEGKGFFHPNPQHRAAAIRGDGQLEGYGQE
ncbi:hypothetical protein D7Z26_11100 [Cohnella endophytica]|uniref:Uncharacterized protein n=1 Tax=Cohnella endophytica TaxID=2419778 RepID=A0A494XW77_9BACL|nr:hypothetical protein [Cohnella endophytica]RKP53934.1 hypothetical protein D7Z26_11100 [Cohnella endophytica]